MKQARRKLFSHNLSRFIGRRCAEACRSGNSLPRESGTKLAIPIAIGTIWQIKKYRHMKLLPLLFLLVLIGCKKEIFIPISQNIEVETYAPEVVGEQLILTGAITSNPDSIVIDSIGFIVGKDETIIFSDILTVGYAEKIVSGTFSVKILDNFNESEEIYVKAFFKINGQIKYGSAKKILGKGKLLPQINSFSPSMGSTNDYVKIFGTHFTLNNSSLKVFIGDYSAEVENISNESILIKVPEYTNPEYCKIRIKADSHLIESKDTFLLYGPWVHSIQPSTIKGKATVTIKGENFSSIRGRNSVKIGRYSFDILEATENEIVAYIDARTVLPNNYKIQVMSDGHWNTNGPNFAITSNWQQLQNLPLASGVSGPCSVRIDDNIYLFNGKTNWLTLSGLTNAVFEYNTVSLKWTRKKDFPGGARMSCAQFVLNNKAYITTGYGMYESYNDLWEYDHNTDSWSKKRDFPGEGLADVRSFSYNNKGYFCFGSPNGLSLLMNEFWEYNPITDGWKQLSDFPGSSRRGAYVAVLNDKAYVIGGSYDNIPFEPDIWAYDFKSEKWEFVDYLGDIAPSSLFYENNKCYIVQTNLDKSVNQYESILYEYNPAENEITDSLFIFPGDYRYGAVTILYGSDIYYGTGSIGGNGQCINDFWKFSLENK